MIRYTTPTLAINISADLSQATNIIVTLKQGDVFLKKEHLTYSQGKVLLPLNESETAAFQANQTAKVQINWTYTDNGVEKRAATYAGMITIRENMLQEVLIGE